MKHTIEYVRGELAFCTTCKGGEGSLPTECPGRPMNRHEDARVYAGSLDFRDARWQSRGALVVKLNARASTGVDRWPMETPDATTRA